MTWDGVDRRNVDQATRLGVWLLNRAGIFALALVLIYVALGFMAIGIVAVENRARSQLDKLEELIRSGEARDEETERFGKVIQEFNQGHADAATRNFKAILDALECATVKVLEQPPAPVEEIRRCYRPVTPAPKAPGG